jgi:hypothetical protein
MPRQPECCGILCEFFEWRLFRRAYLIYADGRGGKYNFGKHALDTKDEVEAKAWLKELDRANANTWLNAAKDVGCDCDTK